MSELKLDGLFSDIARDMKPSPIREMMPLIKRPGMISFAGGNPDPRIFPADEFASCASVIGRDAADVLQYGATDGYEPLKSFVANWMASRMGRVVEPNELLITSGSQQGMDLLCAALINPGDMIIVEDPTYPGAIHAMRNRGAGFITVPCDREGMMVDLLPEKIETARRAGARVKFIYSITNFQNPAGCTLSSARRKKLLEMASDRGLVLFEDDPYGHLRYDGVHEPTIFSMDSESRVAYACSFSKILAPGTRVAWIVAHPDIIRKMVMIKQGADMSASVVAQALVAQYCESGRLDSFLPKIIAHYKKKRDDMARAFAEYLPADVEYNVPEGGFFFWLRVPGVDSQDLFMKAIDRGVAFVHGRAFYANGGGKNSFRTCFTFASGDDIAEGARRLRDAINDFRKR
jgi:2-aminoadipate transaminase